MSLVDLTQPLRAGMAGYPGDPPIERSSWATMDADGYRLSELRLGSHAGTHVDAPSHTEPDGATLDGLPVDRFVFEARRVDCTGKQSREPIAVADLPDFGDGVDLLVFHTGWDAHWGTERYRDHPYLDPPAARRCAAAGVSVAMDAFGPDPTPSPSADDADPEGFPAHHALLGANSVIVENLRNLDSIPTDRFTLYAFPLALADADGAPVRAVASVR